MGIRLRGFDYTRPYFYMVTVKRAGGFPEFARVVGDAACHYLEANATTRLFVDIIKTFHETWYCIEPITCFAIMPDHIHLLIKIRDVEKRVSLPVIVRMLTRALEKASPAAGGAAAGDRPGGAGRRNTLTGAGEGGTLAGAGDRPGGAGLRNTLTGAGDRPGGAGLRNTLTGAGDWPGGASLRSTLAGAGDRPGGAGLRSTLTGAGKGGGGKRGAVDRSAGQHLFELDWHDWIVKRDGQLAAFTRYIRENAERSWLRRSHREYFQRVNEISFLGRKWYGYGNAELLKLPVLEPFRCSRKWAEGGEEWRAAVARASRIGPGGAGVSTFMSPCEKTCGHALGLAGGRWIVLSPEGFGARWHPGRAYERFCAEGRMLFISLWPAMAREPTRAELYDRCHLMGDLVVAGLGANAD